MSTAERGVGLSLGGYTEASVNLKHSACMYALLLLLLLLLLLVPDVPQVEIVPSYSIDSQALVKLFIVTTVNQSVSDLFFFFFLN